MDRLEWTEFMKKAYRMQTHFASPVSESIAHSWPETHFNLWHGLSNSIEIDNYTLPCNIEITVVGRIHALVALLVRFTLLQIKLVHVTHVLKVVISKPFWNIPRMSPIARML